MSEIKAADSRLGGLQSCSSKFVMSSRYLMPYMFHGCRTTCCGRFFFVEKCLFHTIRFFSLSVRIRFFNLDDASAFDTCSDWRKNVVGKFFYSWNSLLSFFLVVFVMFNNFINSNSMNASHECEHENSIKIFVILFLI